MKDGFFRIDENGDSIAMTDEEIKNAVEEFYSLLGINSDGNDDNEELPAPPEEIWVDMDSIQ